MSDLLDRSASSNSPHRVLLVAHAFPPTGGPGVQRSVKFAKYLPGFGWRPIVWAADHVDGLPDDPTLLEGLPAEITVHRQGSGSIVHGIRRSLRTADHHPITSRVTRVIGWRLDGWLERQGFPEGYANWSWAQSSIRPLCRLIESEDIDVIYTTLSPVANHVVGLALKRKIGIPWVADFRDLWTDDYRYHESSTKLRIANRRKEQEFLEAADVVIGVTERQTEILADHVPSHRHKFLTITNGFDPADFRDDSRVAPREDDLFVLVYTGRLDRWRSSDAWFDGLKGFADRLGDDRRRFLLRLIGHTGTEMRKRIKEIGIRCELTGYVSHTDAVRAMQSADALLLSVPDGPNADANIPAKLFEYLAAGRPILAIGPPAGQCERIVRSCEAGLTVGFDGRAIADALERLFAAWVDGHPLGGCRPERLDRFSRIELTRRLASVLDGLVPAKPVAEDHSGALIGAPLR